MSNESGGRLKLWDTPHSYYCEEGNFFKNGLHTVFESWEDFAQPISGQFMEKGNTLYDFDNDFNFLYRWDWIKADPENYLFSSSDEILDEINATQQEIEESKKQFEEDSKIDKLMLFFMLQRKSYNISAEVKVTESDEPAVREWLQKKWEYMKGMWEPLSI